LGIQNAMIHLYRLDRADKQAFRERLLEISQKWSPYRTYACMHLWRWKDNSPALVNKAQPSKPGKTKAKAAVKTGGKAKGKLGAMTGKAGKTAKKQAKKAQKKAGAGRKK
ncbi:MAG TPA: hypothetical protein VNU72_04170, partial [Puia sp.]|nr:hypothetical protein [Puia sp.]